MLTSYYQSTRLRAALAADSALIPVQISRSPPRFGVRPAATVPMLAPGADLGIVRRADLRPITVLPLDDYRALAEAHNAWIAYHPGDLDHAPAAFDWPTFEATYTLLLDTIGPNPLYSLLTACGPLDKLILLCYEKPPKPCHRHLLAAWLTRHTDLPIAEL